MLSLCCKCCFVGITIKKGFSRFGAWSMYLCPQWFHCTLKSGSNSVDVNFFHAQLFSLPIVDEHSGVTMKAARHQQVVRLINGICHEGVEGDKITDSLQVWKLSGNSMIVSVQKLLGWISIKINHQYLSIGNLNWSIFSLAYAANKLSWRKHYDLNRTKKASLQNLCLCLK